jgi:hypothetical protein
VKPLAPNGNGAVFGQIHIGAQSIVLITDVPLLMNSRSGRKAYQPTNKTTPIAAIAIFSLFIVTSPLT